jgi:hypothetical protein
MSWNGRGVTLEAVSVASKNTDKGATPDARLAATDSVVVPDVVRSGVVGHAGIVPELLVAIGWASAEAPLQAEMTAAARRQRLILIGPESARFRDIRGIMRLGTRCSVCNDLARCIAL